MCLSVVFVYSLVCNCECCMYIVKSRKDISLSKMSLVNLMVGCTLLKCSMNFKSEFIP